MMLLEGNDASSVADDELDVEDSFQNDILFDLDELFGDVGGSESPQGAGSESLRECSESEGLQPSSEIGQGNGHCYSVTDNGLRNTLSSYQNDNEHDLYDTAHHSQQSNFHSMSNVIQSPGPLDLNVPGKVPFDTRSYCEPSYFGDHQYQGEDLFESTGTGYNEWDPSGNIVTRATDVVSSVMGNIYYAGQDQLSYEGMNWVPPTHLPSMLCSNSVPLLKDEIKDDCFAGHDRRNVSHVKTEKNSIKREGEMPNSSFVNQVSGNPRLLGNPSIKMETNSLKMKNEMLKTYQSAQNTTIGPIDVEDDFDLCILEDMSAPAPSNRVALNAKSVSTMRNPAVQTVTTQSRFKLNDESNIFRVALQDLIQPKSQANPPDGVLSVPLLKHQRIALSWMVKKETTSACCSGGILADDQGLGKTVSTIALILKERSPSSKCCNANEKQSQTETLNLDDDDDDGVFEAELPQLNGCRKSPLAKGRSSGGTLIVCPTSVLRQWSDELHNKVTREADLSVLVYYGSSRTKDPVELAKYDVVITTYAIVSMEVPKQPVVNEDEKLMDSQFKELPSSKKRKLFGTNRNSSSSKKIRKGNDGELFGATCGPLAQVGWFRVVLDEAQSIKNHRTQAARACWGLRAKRRWCLSGTPIQNTIDDLYSYFRFLRHEPYAVFRTFCDQLKVPINRNPRNGYKKLQAVLKTIMLRRTKATFIDGEPIINLPPKTIELRKVDFSEEERTFYCRLEADSRAQFAEYAAAGTVKQNYVNILLMLLRLRQACDHPRLVKGFSSSLKMRSSIEMAKKLSREKQSFLLSCLEASLAICGICSDPPEDAVVTVCGHVFCHQCICEHLIGDSTQCPSKKCKTHLTMPNVFSIAALRTAISEQSNAETTTEPHDADVSESHSPPTIPQNSSKIDAALDILLSLSSDKAVPDKAIVFSQWTGMLDLLEASLKENNIQYRRLDGTMPVTARDRAVKDFKSIPQVSVMIMSLKAASLGLNMVAACNVILLDLWWNPTTEDQAIDRAHRIGQTRPVSVYRLTVKDTVEDRILALQQRKRKMVASAFGENESGARQSKLTVDDLKYLFRV